VSLEPSALELGASGLTRTPSDRHLVDLARSFEEHDVVHLPGFFDAALLARIRRLSDEIDLSPREHRGIGRELSTMSGPLFSMLLFCANDPGLLQIVERVTGLAPLRSFEGRIYRLDASGTYDSWHSDVFDTRQVGMSVNISSEPYAGGTFEIRRVDRPDQIRAHPNLEPGGAILFRIADHLRHQVTPVTSEAPKTAFAGWFRSEPDFRDVLAGRAKL
jgi:hypothetical protein